MALSYIQKLTQIGAFLCSLFISQIPQAHEHLPPSQQNEINPLNTLNKSYINAFFLGDSQTLGRAKEKTTHSSVSALAAIWPLVSNNKLNIKSNGKSGRTLAGTHQAYLNISTNERKALDWVHFQESGNQLSGGGTQNTPEKFAHELKKFILDIRKHSPKAIISTETAYSFEAENMKGRDWTRYNKSINKTIEELRKQHVNVYVAQVDANIKSLVFNMQRISDGKRGQEAVWGDQDNKIKRHYTGLGNTMVGLSVLKAIGLDLQSIRLSNIPDSEIEPIEKDLLLKILSEK